MDPEFCPLFVRDMQRHVSFELPSSDSETELDQLLLGTGHHVEPEISDVDLPSDVEETRLGLNGNMFFGFRSLSRGFFF